MYFLTVRGDNAIPSFNNNSFAMRSSPLSIQDMNILIARIKRFAHIEFPDIQFEREMFLTQ